MTNFSRAGLIVKFNDESVASTLTDVISCLEGLGLEIILDDSTGGLIEGRPTVPISEIAAQCDLVIVIGGDGTLLNAARSVVDYNIPIVGINRGRLGFLVDVSPSGGLDELSQISTRAAHRRASCPVTDPHTARWRMHSQLLRVQRHRHSRQRTVADHGLRHHHR